MLKVILLYYIQAVISIILTFNMKFPRIDSVLEKKDGNYVYNSVQSEMSFTF